MLTVLSGSGSFHQDAATQILHGNYASESTKEQIGGWLLQKLSLWKNGMGFYKEETISPLVIIHFPFRINHLSINTVPGTVCTWPQELSKSLLNK